MCIYDVAILVISGLLTKNNFVPNGPLSIVCCKERKKGPGEAD